VQVYNYNWEIKDILTQFLQAFDGAIVKRFDNKRKPGTAVAVRYVYSPKERVLNDLVNKAQTITIPAVAFSIGSISRDVNRVFNKTNGFYYNLNSTDTESIHTLQPVPINIVVNISILTKFQTDMDQILSNFVPWSDPYFIISWTNQAMPGNEIRTEVLWDGNLRLKYPFDINNNQPTQVTCDTSFTIKGWLFKSESSPAGRIFKIDSNFYTVSAIPANESAYGEIYNALNGLQDTIYNETETVSARPQPAYVSKYTTVIGSSGTVVIYGDMLGYTNAVYVSGAPGMFTTTTTVTTFLSSTSLSAKYPALYNVTPVLNYYIESSNKIVVTYPAPLIEGTVDVIIFNEAGYSSILPNFAL
jgi:T4-like virus Myoviridae tail sheath stabiliser